MEYRGSRYAEIDVSKKSNIQLQSEGASPSTFVGQSLWSDGVKSRATIQEEQPDIRVTAP